MDGEQKGRKGGACALGDVVVRVNSHTQRQSCTLMSLKTSIHAPPEEHMYASMRAKDQASAICIVSSHNTRVCTNEQEQMRLCKHVD